MNPLSDTSADADLAPCGGDSMDTPTEAEPARLPEIEESLNVGKIEVDRGGYRVTKRIEMREEIVDELLRHERVTVERRTVGRTLDRSEVPAPRYEGDTLIVPVIEEVVVTEKRWVLVEEVLITRTVGTHRDPQPVQLRKENIEIERLGASNTVIRSS